MPYKLLNLFYVVCFICSCATSFKTATIDTSAKSYKSGLTLMELKNYRQAQQVFENILKTDSTYSPARSALGHCYLELGRPFRADSVFNIVLSKEPENASAMIGLARCRILQNKPQEAVALLEKLLRTSSYTFAEKTEAMFIMADALRIQGQADRSANFYRAVLKRDPNHVKAQLALEDLEAAKNDHDEVLEIMNKSVVTRKDVAVLMRSLSGIENAPLGNGILPRDMTEGDSAYFDVIFALSSGLVRILPDSSFRPDYVIDRAAMAAMLQHALSVRLGISKLEYRYFDRPALFKDVPDIGFLKNPPEVVTRAGLMSGWPDGTFRPDETVSGREAYEMIRRLFQLQPSIKEVF